MTTPWTAMVGWDRSADPVFRGIGQDLPRAALIGFDRSACAPSSQFDATLGFPGEGPNCKPLRIQSANITAWNSWVQAHKSGEFRDCDILLLQEHKLPERDIRSAQELLKGIGFRPEFGPATTGLGGGNSSGVAIAWRNHLQVRQAGQGIPGSQDQQHRLAWIDYDLPGVGYTRIYSVYGDPKTRGTHNTSYVN